MGFYLRKSLKFGPIRFNFSKHGVGYSVGPKGLKLGVDSLGRGYVSGGKSGIYFRHYVSKSKNSNVLQTQNNNSSFKFFIYLVFLLLLVYFFGLKVLFLLIALFFIYKLVRLNSDKKVEKFIYDLSNSYNDFNNFLLIFNEIPLKLREEVLINSYEKILENIVLDNKIDSQEEKVLQFIKSKIDLESFSQFNIYLANKLIRKAFSDNILTNSEELFLSKLVSILELESVKQDLVALIKQYKELRKDKKLKFEYSNKLKQEVAFSGVGELFKQQKSGKKVFKSGEIFITNKGISILSKGIYQIKFNNIDLIEKIDDNIFQIELNNRVNPIFLEIDKPMLFLTTLNQIINKSK